MSFEAIVDDGRRTKDDARRTTDDGRRTLADGNSSPWAYGSGELKIQCAGVGKHQIQVYTTQKEIIFQTDKY